MLSAIKRIVPNDIKNQLKTTIYKIVEPPFVEQSYSQAGEDRILSYFFRTIGVNEPSYLDIGANHPSLDNNTYLFYKRGGRGVCVEADPSLINELSKVRERDICLNVGITFDNRKEADFYVFPISALNTLSKEEADFREQNGSHKVAKVITIPLQTINEIIDENFSETPDLLSLDVEGIDLEILKSLDWVRHRPLAICVETITYSENRTEQKITEIADFIQSNGYFAYADTHINTIFVDEKKFRGLSSVV